MSISLLSKHRKELMTIAMLWIAIYHSSFPINSKLISFALSKCGYGGVDLFLFLSSFGLYYAYKNYQGYWKFIRRRLLRILPYSIPFFVLVFLSGKMQLNEMIEFVLGVSLFFRTDKLYWFVSFILFLYVLTPFYLKAFNKSPLFATIISISITFVICLLINNLTFTYIFFRIAVYALGFYFGYLNDHKVKSKIFYITFVILFVFGWIFLYYMYHNFGNDIEHVYPFLFITPGALMILAFLLDKINIFNKVFVYMSEYTFVFYLLHSEILWIFYSKYGELFIPGIHFDFLINFFAIVISFFLSIVYKRVIDKILNVIIK